MGQRGTGGEAAGVTHGPSAVERQDGPDDRGRLEGRGRGQLEILVRVSVHQWGLSAPRACLHRNPVRPQSSRSRTAAEP